MEQFHKIERNIIPFDSSLLPVVQSNYLEVYRRSFGNFISKIKHQIPLIVSNRAVRVGFHYAQSRATREIGEASDSTNSEKL
jgi:hypothetical protein